MSAARGRGPGRRLEAVSWEGPRRQAQGRGTGTVCSSWSLPPRSLRRTGGGGRRCAAHSTTLPAILFGKKRRGLETDTGWSLLEDRPASGAVARLFWDGRRAVGLRNSFYRG